MRCLLEIARLGGKAFSAKMLPHVLSIRRRRHHSGLRRAAGGRAAAAGAAQDRAGRGLFCKSRGANPNADVKGTHNVIAGQISGVMNSMAGSKKKNCGRGTHFSARDLDSGKIQRRKLN